MDFANLNTVLLCIMLFFVHFKDVSSLTVTVSKSAEKAVLGDNPFTLSCTYTFTSNVEQLFSIELKRKRETDSVFDTIVIFQNPSSLLNATYSDTSLESRTVATNPTDSNKIATLVFDQIECDDKATYMWNVLYTDGQVKTVEKDLSFVVKGIAFTVKVLILCYNVEPYIANTRFKDDGSVSLSQNTNIEEGDKIVFTCTGDVGNEPVGHLGWFYYLINDTSIAINASSLAHPTSPVYQSSTCSYRRTSTLELTMTSSFHNIMVRCTVQQDKFDQYGNNYVQTNNIPVYYYPKITSIEDQTVEEGKESLKLLCVADAYPAPVYSWVLPDGTVSEGPSYTLSNLQLGDNGTYTCVVYNTYKGANHTVNETTYINVHASSLKVTVSESAEKAVIGDNPFTLSCTYAFTSNGQQLFSIELKRKRETDDDFVNIVTFQNPSSLLNASYSDTSLESRTVATNPTDSSKTATLMFSQIECDDKATYRWNVLYTDGHHLKTEMKYLSFVVKANSRFKDDGSVSLSQNTNIEEGDKIVLTCAGDVGNEPVGHLSWFYYLHKDTSIAINASSLAKPTSLVYQPNTCSYRRTSTLELAMTIRFHNILVRCTAQQDKFDQYGNGYVQTNNIPVYYSPKITSIEDQTVEVGKESLELLCVADAYPAPVYSWVLPDGTVSDGHSCTLSNLQLGDNGTYTCIVYNTYKGANHTVNETTYINVRYATLSVSGVSWLRSCLLTSVALLGVACLLYGVASVLPDVPGSVKADSTQAPTVPNDKSEDKSIVIALAVTTGLSITAAGAAILVAVYCVKRRKRLNSGIPEETHTYQGLAVYENKGMESPYTGLYQEQQGQ